MWPLFLIGGVVIVGGWLWGASKVASNAPPLAHDTFTASGKIQIGDIVEVALNSVEIAATEGTIDDPPGVLPHMPNLSVNDMKTINDLSSFADAGGTGKFQVTATDLRVSKQGNAPLAIGVELEPKLSIRVPFVFLEASVRSVTRNGKRVG